MTGGVGHTGGLTNPRPWRRRCRAGYSNTGGPPLPRKRAPSSKKKGGNFSRYLSRSDYQNCIPGKDSRLCQKRRVEIVPHHGCGIKLQNCGIWATTVARDRSNTEIMIYATVRCDDGTDRQLRLPIRAIINLSLHFRQTCSWFGKLANSSR